VRIILKLLVDTFTALCRSLHWMGCPGALVDLSRLPVTPAVPASIIRHGTEIRRTVFSVIGVSSQGVINWW
jgi:hypothetical protein